MSIIRHLPLAWRLPLIHSGTEALMRLRLNLNQHYKKPARIKPGSFVVSAYNIAQTGIGRAGRQTVKCFWQNGYDVLDHDLQSSTALAFSGNLNLPGKDGVWLINANAPEASQTLLAHNPASWQDRYRIAYWTWETQIIPSDWVFTARFFHEIWVPSTFVYDAVSEGFKANDAPELIERLRIMPYHVPEIGMSDISRASFGLSDDLCEVLCLFDIKSSVTRKNPWSALTAWTKAFPEPSTLARLTLKINADGADLNSVSALFELTKTRPDIRIITQCLSDEEMHSFIGAFDALISLHRSEGFALTIAEAMQAGVAVIATDYSGNTDFMTDLNSMPIPYRLVPINDRDGHYAALNGSDQVWAEPDIVAASYALSRLVKNPEMRKALGARAKTDIAKLNSHWSREMVDKLELNRWVKSFSHS